MNTILHCICCHDTFIVEENDPDLIWIEAPMCAPCNTGFCFCNEFPEFAEECKEEHSDILTRLSAEFGMGRRP